MSMRSSSVADQTNAPHIQELRNGLDQMRSAEIAVQRDAEVDANFKSPTAENGLSMLDLTPTERSAASLGVAPGEWRPIAFLNTGHYSELLKNNVLSEKLAQGVEAYKSVAAGSS